MSKLNFYISREGINRQILLQNFQVIPSFITRQREKWMVQLKNLDMDSNIVLLSHFYRNPFFYVIPKGILYVAMCFH